VKIIPEYSVRMGQICDFSGKNVLPDKKINDLINNTFAPEVPDTGTR
jgi:hypothetical protein